MKELIRDIKELRDFMKEWWVEDRRGFVLSIIYAVIGSAVFYFVMYLSAILDGNV
jgi:hypothetical protein